jgi:hypothetical protein
MNWKVFVLVGAAAVAGCGAPTPPPANNVLNPPADDKAKIEAILKEYGIVKPVAVVRDNGEYWHVAMGELPPEAAGPGEAPKSMTSTGPPDEYKVYKDGRVSKAFDDAPLKKK